jgi:hypothetical protein
MHSLTRRLKMAIALTRKQITFILEEDKEQDESLQTKFSIKPLSAKQYAAVQDSMHFTGKGEDATITNSGAYALEVLKYGLTGWSNFKNEDGQEVKFNTRNIEESLDYLSVSNRYEISAAIMELSILGEKEKN